MIYIFIVQVFLVLQSIEASARGTPNVGTVLFTRADADNKTWTKHNLALLRARLYFQHLIPPFISPQTPDYIGSLLKYFKDGYISISNESKDLETDKILTSAFTDVIGGYLKMFALPITKYAYYGGTLPKRDALKLFLFYEDVKKYLGKNGTGWAAPDMSVLKAVTIDVAVPTGSQAKSVSDRESCHHLTLFEKTPAGLTIPTPIIDWSSHTMFIPLANKLIVDLHSPDVSDVLHKYHRIATNCIRSSKPANLDDFNLRFQEWLQDDVMPHLNDDPLYAALQGVLCLINSSTNPEAISTYNDVLTALAVKPEKKYYDFTKKQIIIMIIVLLEVLCCVPTLLYVLCRGKKTCKPSRSSRVNIILESRSDRSDSEFSDCSSKSRHIRKRYGGVMLKQKPYSTLEVGAVYSSHSIQSVGTETVGRRVFRRSEDAATMVDEVAARRSRRSSKVQTNENPVIIIPATKTETSDDTGKTVTLSTINPSRATTVKISSGIKETTDEGLLPTASRSEYSSLSSKSIKKDLRNTRSRKGGKDVDLLISEICKESALIMQPTPVAELSEKEVRENEKKIKAARTSNGGCTGFKIHTEDNMFKIQGGDKPYLEIRIDKPQHEISVGISQNEKRKQTESHMHACRMSRIPKRAPGSRTTQIKVTRFKDTSPEFSQDVGLQRRSMIPKLKRALDDSALGSNKGSKTSKLNVTL